MTCKHRVDGLTYEYRAAQYGAGQHSPTDGRCATHFLARSHRRGRRRMLRWIQLARTRPSQAVTAPSSPAPMSAPSPPSVLSRRRGSVHVVFASPVGRTVSSSTRLAARASLSSTLLSSVSPCPFLRSSISSSRISAPSRHGFASPRMAPY